MHAQADKAARVRRMFDAIAPTYELINALFSGGRDRAWRRRTVARAAVQPGDAVLDACALPAGPWRWPPSIDGLLAADGAVDLDGLAAVITDRWRGAR